jgi:hypothetical protein
MLGAKALLTSGQALTLAVLAGVFIGFGGAAFTMVMTGADSGFGPARFLGGVVFTLGLILVVVGGAGGVALAYRFAYLRRVRACSRLHEFGTALHLTRRLCLRCSRVGALPDSGHANGFAGHSIAIGIVAGMISGLPAFCRGQSDLARHITPAHRQQVLHSLSGFKRAGTQIDRKGHAAGHDRQACHQPDDAPGRQCFGSRAGGALLASAGGRVLAKILSQGLKIRHLHWVAAVCGKAMALRGMTAIETGF